MIPYRTRNALRKVSITALVLVLVITCVLLCWLLWLNRYVLYTRTGAIFNFSLPQEFPAGETVSPPVTGETIDIFYNEGENAIHPENTKLTQLGGVYATGSMLSESFDATKSALMSLPSETPIMLDVKSIRGTFYYSTNLGRTEESIPTKDMDMLISNLDKAGHYLIARLPALRDYWYGLEHVDDGIFNPNRLSLWIDDQRCYWLNPSSEGTLNYLVRIVTELKSLGFDEVVFTDFRLPDTNAIYFNGDRDAAINEAAKSLATICSSDNFCVSFVSSSETFQLPQGRTRLYLENVVAAEAAPLAQKLGLPDPAIQMVFLTELKDTRFDDYGVLRPVTLPE